MCQANRGPRRVVRRARCPDERTPCCEDGETLLEPEGDVLEEGSGKHRGRRRSVLRPRKGAGSDRAATFEPVTLDACPPSFEVAFPQGFGIVEGKRMDGEGIDETASRNPLLELRAAGQSVWLDFLRRDLIDSGELSRRIREDGLAGVTTNPAIFERAISSGPEYEARLDEAVRAVGSEPLRVYEFLATADVRDAADLLRPVFDSTGGVDGYVSLEVSPERAHDTQGTVEEGIRLFQAVGRPNVMIKVPATEGGIPAIRELLVAGIPVNVTLLFSGRRYQQVAVAYLEALEARVERGLDVHQIASVASFFVSRIDTALDRVLASAPGGAALCGRIAIANARRAYRWFGELLHTPRWAELESRGARPQRLLWASTSTKNPAYRDTLYVEELVAPQTVNTMPPETLEAFRDHGTVRPFGAAEIELAERELAGLEPLGIDLEEVCRHLLSDGVRKFAEPFEKLLSSLEARVRDLASTATS